MRSANGDQKVRKYLFPEIFYGRQEVHKYFCTSVNINPSEPSRVFTDHFTDNFIFYFFV